MTADLKVFRFADREIRTVLIDGEVWFVAGDVAAVLGYRMGSDLARTLDEDERGTHRMRTPSGDQAVIVISEAGLFRAIVQRQSGRIVDESSRAQVKAFQRWVTHELLPAVNRGEVAVQAPALSGVELLARAVLEANEMLQEKDARIAVLEPKAAVADTLLNAEGDWSVGDAAKILSRRGAQVKERSLWPALADRGWIFRAADGRWHVYSHAMKQGVMSVIPQSHYHPRTGELVTDAPQCRVTPKGIERLFAAMTSTAVERAS